MFESSDSWVEMFVSKVALLRLCPVVKVVATPAAKERSNDGTDIISAMAPTVAKGPLARTSPTCCPHRRIKWSCEWIHDEGSLESGDDGVGSYVTGLCSVNGQTGLKHASGCQVIPLSLLLQRARQQGARLCSGSSSKLCRCSSEMTVCFLHHPEWDFTAALHVAAPHGPGRVALPQVPSSTGTSRLLCHRIWSRTSVPHPVH